MKNWLRHPVDINEPLTGAEMAGLTFAGTALSVLQVVISVFITYFFTNVVGISAAVVGTLLLVTRVADGFSDLGMGAVIAKTRSRWGQARPWSFRLALPLLISVVLTFSVPGRWDLTAKTAYSCITYFLMTTVTLTPAGLVGSILGTNMTVNPKSRQKSAILSCVFTMLGSVAGNVAVLNITQAMGDSYEAWRLVGVVFGLLAFAGQAAQFLLTREREVTLADADRRAAKASAWAALPALKNRYFIIMCLVGMIGALDSAMAGCIVYYVKYVLFNMELVSIISAVTLLFMLAGTALTPILAKKIPAKRLILTGLAVKIVSFIINLCNPGNLPLFVGFTALRSLMGAPMMVYNSVYLLNTIEYGEYKTGVRANHLIVTVSSVWSKIGSGLGGGLIGWLLSLGGYDGAAAAQGLAAQNMIINACFLIPLIASAATLILLCMYDLDKKYAQIMSALKMRKNAAAAG